MVEPAKSSIPADIAVDDLKEGDGTNADTDPRIARQTESFMVLC